MIITAILSRQRQSRSVLVLLVSAICSVISGSLYADDAKHSTSTFNQQWLDTVISIEASKGGKNPEPVGTGFLVQTARKHVLIVTAKHVVNDLLASKSSRLGYRLNVTDARSIVVWDDELRAKGLGEWHLSSTADVACRFVAWPSSARIVTIAADNFLKSEVLMAGAPILVLGFPLGLRSTVHARAIARHGIIARADPDGIIAEVFMFPGNSGGPVVYSPSFKPGRGLSSQLATEEKLVGIVSSFIPYQEPAISPYTKRVRIMFEENSGLAELVHTDRVLELIGSESVKKQDAALP